LLDGRSDVVNVLSAINEQATIVDLAKIATLKTA
jgi:hypothetical protein